MIMKTNYEKQAMDFLEKTCCKMTITYKENRKYFTGDKETRDVYDVKIERGKRKFKFEFGNSIANSQFSDRNAPSEYSVLSCLTKHDPESFENFCNEFGYDEDSRNAERTYNAVVKEWKNVCMIWTDDEMEELLEIY